MRAWRRGKELVAAPKLLFRRFRPLGETRMAAKRALAAVSRAVWRAPLDRDETVRMVADSEIAVANDGVFPLPRREPLTGGPVHPFFDKWDVVFEPEYVWRLKRSDDIRSIRLTPTGTILLNNKKLLHTDFGSVQGVGSSPVKRLKAGRVARRRVDVDIAIAPWSHGWATYYEFLVHVLSKLCWIKEEVDPATWEAARFCYPLFETPYERQYLSLLGINNDVLLNTRYVDPRPESLIISNLQGQHRLLTPTRLRALRDAFLPRSGTTQKSGRRLYLSREGAKREVLNEGEVRQVVTKYDIEVVDTIPVDVEEQIRMFSEASLIVCPHGSALANLVWCSPGTRVIELFTRSFMSHLYNYMSLLLGLQHEYLVDNAREPHHWTNMHKDIFVDVGALAKALDRVGADQ